MNRIAAALVAVVVLFPAAAFAQAQAAPQRLRGDVVALAGAMLTLRTDDGRVRAVQLAKDVRISARSRADLAAIGPGAFIGTTATPQADGTLAAVEVHIFPESMRGTGEGHRPMPALPGSTMTNATVTAVGAADAGAPRNTMTNATVANVASSGESRRITLRYAGGEQTVVVAASVPVVMVEPGDASLLVPGAHVLVNLVAGPAGTLTADRVTVGKDGLVPPG